MPFNIFKVFRRDGRSSRSRASLDSISDRPLRRDVADALEHEPHMGPRPQRRGLFKKSRKYQQREGVSRSHVGSRLSTIVDYPEDERSITRSSSSVTEDPYRDPIITSSPAPLHAVPYDDNHSRIHEGIDEKGLHGHSDDGHRGLENYPHGFPDSRRASSHAKREPAYVAHKHHAPPAGGNYYHLKTARSNESLGVGPTSRPVILRVEEGVELEIGNEVDGFMPYDEYEAAQRRRPPPQDTYYVVPSGMNVIFQDEDGNEIHRVGDFDSGFPSGRPRPYRHPIIFQDENGQEIARYGDFDDVPRSDSGRTGPRRVPNVVYIDGDGRQSYGANFYGSRSNRSVHSQMPDVLFVDEDQHEIPQNELQSRPAKRSQSRESQRDGPSVVYIGGSRGSLVGSLVGSRAGSRADSQAGSQTGSGAGGSHSSVGRSRPQASDGVDATHII